MSTSGEAEPLPTGGKPYRATYLELFFDLVFVFGLAQLSNVLISDLSWRGLVRTLVALLALWWVWSYTVWMTDRLGVHRLSIQVTVIGTMLGSLLMAIAAPAAFAEQGIVFAVAYVAIQLGRVVITVTTVHGQPERVNIRWLALFLTVALGPWIAGVFTSGIARAALWALAVGLAYTLDRFDVPVVRLTRAHRREWAISAEHLGERHQHFAIIALGDTILSAGLIMTTYDFTGQRITALAVAFASTVLLWRIYFYRAGELLPETIEAARVPPRIALWASYAHLLMVIGIVIIAVADALVIAGPYNLAGPGQVATILGGPALFLLGRAVLDYVTFSVVAASRLIGLLVIAALLQPAMGKRPITIATVAVIVLFGVAVSDTIEWRRRPSKLAPPERGPGPDATRHRRRRA